MIHLPPLVSYRLSQSHFCLGVTGSRTGCLSSHQIVGHDEASENANLSLGPTTASTGQLTFCCHAKPERPSWPIQGGDGLRRQVADATTGRIGAGAFDSVLLSPPILPTSGQPEPEEMAFCPTC
ncbi:unnamed protein product [Protopolystoma xenopodis]|uniref:Uncharacterized protein n=1 Tax=Protopolystoma xenopodis TaxID=117903 RepID=A0A448XEF1_9PLAT|nr:unnamed protein product [Protopolystoma xenopodis]